MKYVLPLMLAASAAWAATDQTTRPWVESEPTLQAAPQPETPDWMTALKAVSEVAPLAASNATDDPHVGQCTRPGEELPHVHASSGDDPHVHASSGDDPHVHASSGDDPHALVRAGSPDVAAPTAPLSRSTATNGHDVVGLFAKRTELSEKLVRVHGLVVKKTDGILGKTYLHLRDGTGSSKNGDNDLTVTTTESFEPGEAVELEGRVRIDQDLGLGYRYAVLLDEATRVQVN